MGQLVLQSLSLLVQLLELQVVGGGLLNGQLQVVHPLLRPGHRPLGGVDLLLQVFGPSRTLGLLLPLRGRLFLWGRKLCPSPLPGRQVLLIVPLEIGDGPPLQHPDPGGEPLDEVAVVGDEEQIALILLHRLLDPLPALDVQMVGGLVQDQQVDFAVHQHTQPQTALLPAGQGGHWLEHVLPPELEGGQPVPGALGGAVQVVNHGVYQGALRVLKVDNLGQVSHPDRGTLPQLSSVGLRLPHDDFDEGGLACAVVPQQGDALSPLHLQVHVVEEGALPVGLSQLLDGQHLVPSELPLPEAHRHLPLPFGPVGDPHTLDALLHGLGPLEDLVVPRVGPDAQLLRGLLQLLDLGLLLFVLPPLLLIPPLLLHGVEAVAARVKFRLSLLDLHHPLDHLVQKVPVVGDRQHRPPEFFQIPLQPLGGPQVQVVCGLVQQQDVGVLQNQPP